MEEQNRRHTDLEPIPPLLAGIPPRQGAPRPRILVVDDSPRMRWAVGELLTATGMEVVGEAADGTAALALTSTASPDVVVLDFRMPGADGCGPNGIEVARHLHRIDPFLRTVLFSAAVDEHGHLEHTAREAGVHGVVAKGVLPGILLAAVAAACTESRRARSDTRGR